MDGMTTESAEKVRLVIREELFNFCVLIFIVSLIMGCLGACFGRERQLDNIERNVREISTRLSKVEQRQAYGQ